jgi:hypothetical protein
MTELYQLIPQGAVPYGLLAIGEQFQRYENTGLPGGGVCTKWTEDYAYDSADDPITFYAFELVRPLAPPPPDEQTGIVADIRRQPAPLCTCSVCAGLLDPGECGCVCRVCSSAARPARIRPIRRYILHLCPCCSSTVGSMDSWCSTCGQPLYAPAGTGVPF